MLMFMKTKDYIYWRRKRIKSKWGGNYWAPSLLYPVPGLFFQSGQPESIIEPDWGFRLRTEYLQTEYKL